MNRPQRRLAWCPREDQGESEFGALDVVAAAREISARFLGKAGSFSAPADPR